MNHVMFIWSLFCRVADVNVVSAKSVLAEGWLYSPVALPFKPLQVAVKTLLIDQFPCDVGMGK